MAYTSHGKPRRPDRSKVQPPANVLDANNRYDINAQLEALARVTRSWGMDPDAGLAITAEGKLTIGGPDESQGVTYDPSPQLDPPTIPQARPPKTGAAAAPGAGTKGF